MADTLALLKAKVIARKKHPRRRSIEAGSSEAAVIRNLHLNDHSWRDHTPPALSLAMSASGRRQCLPLWPTCGAELPIMPRHL
jgi:hypothetical protein